MVEPNPRAGNGRRSAFDADLPEMGPRAGFGDAYG